MLVLWDVYWYWQAASNKSIHILQWILLLQVGISPAWAHTKLLKAFGCSDFSQTRMIVLWCLPLSHFFCWRGGGGGGWKVCYDSCQTSLDDLFKLRCHLSRFGTPMKKWFFMSPSKTWFTKGLRLEMGKHQSPILIETITCLCFYSVIGANYRHEIQDAMMNNV